MRYVIQLVFVASLLTANIVSAQSVQLLVPAYANPCCGFGPDMWTKLISAANTPDVEVSVIFNPASGPGTSIDPNFVNALGNGPLIDFKNAGGKVYGYVATTFGTRSVTDVQANINKYYDTLYPGIVDGIFFDEASNNLADVAYANTIRDSVKAKDASALVIANPGTSFTNNPSNQTLYSVDDYANTADVIVTFESSQDDYLNNYTDPAWLSDYDQSHFAHMIHSTSSLWDANLLTLAQSRNAGYVYFTDDTLGNPYDKLATYWGDQLSSVAATQVSAIPLPAAFLLFFPVLSMFGFYRFKLRRS
jgi:hypothetical protein